MEVMVYGTLPLFLSLLPSLISCHNQPDAVLMKYRISRDCKKCQVPSDASASETFYATGNHFNCKYTVGNSNAYLVKSATYAYPFNCQANNANVAPSLGLNGRDCVCYRDWSHELLPFD